MNSFEKIAFHSTILGSGTAHGYGYAAVELIKAWQAQGMPVWWGDMDAPIGINMVQPHWYEQVNKINIGYTPWESTKVPDAWLSHMNKMDQIWTTSKACQKWFIDAGVEPQVKVLHHGINAEHWPATKRKWGIEGPFRFLHVGASSPRKGAQTVYDAFEEAFGEQDEVILVLKGKPNFDVKLKNVYVIDAELSQEDLTKLYLKCHAMIYPTQGEGFGLIPFSAAGSGMPTFVTDFSGPQDYMEFCWPIKVYDMIECDYEPHEGLWALPDLDDIIDHMHNVVDRSGYYFEKAYVKAQQLQETWSWETMAKKSLVLMEQLFQGSPL